MIGCPISLGSSARRSVSVAGIAMALVALAPTELIAELQLLALTGDSQPDGGAKLLGVSAATLNEAGRVAFKATLEHGVGGVSAGNDDAICLVGALGPQVLAREGAGGAPSAGNDPFASFQSLTIDDSDTITLSGTLASAKQGVWRFPAAAAGSALALTGSGEVPGLPDGVFESLAAMPLTSRLGGAAINGKLLTGVAGVNNSNDRGAWLYGAGAPSMLTREGVTAVPDIPGAQFLVPQVSGINDQMETVVLGALVPGPGGVTPPDAGGVWRLTSGGGELIARRSAGGVAGLAGASYQDLQNPTINGSGQIAFSGELVLGGGVTAENHRGVWLQTQSGGQLAARTGVGQVPNVLGAAFASFGPPLLNDGGQILLTASLALGGGGVSPANANGLWLFDAEGSDRLLARSGSGGVPGVAGADFATFDALAFNEHGVAAVQATLVAGVGGVNAANDKGLWLLDDAGGVLVARAGDTLAGRTVTDLEIVGGSAGGDGLPRSFNDSGQLVFKAAFTSGEEGLFLFSANHQGADFTGDGVVDASDLARWRTNFGAAANAAQSDGDADADGDVDGADLLAWQRQLAGGVSQQSPVPEPATALILFAGPLCGAVARRRSAHCPDAAFALV